MNSQQFNSLCLKLSMMCLLISTTSLQLQASSQALLSTYQGTNGPWKYLEYVFIVQPKHQLKQSTTRAFTGLGALGGLFLAIQYLKEKSSDQNKAEVKQSLLQNILIMSSAFAAAKTVVETFTCYTQQTIQKNILINFLKKWNHLREYIPIILIEYFDDLALQYQSGGNALLTDSLVAEVFELVQHHIEHNFENRYKAAEIKIVDPIENFKNLTEVWGNLKK